MGKAKFEVRLVLALAAVLSCGPAFAAFEDGGFSARAKAMGSAFTAVVDDPATVFFNPGSLGFVDRPAVESSYLREYDIPAGKTFQDMIDLVGAVPVKQEILNGTFAGTFISNQQRGLGQERAIGLSYGTRAMHEFDGGQLELGGTFRTLSKTFDAGGNSPMRLGLDIGVTARFHDHLTAGASLMNFDGPPMSGGGRGRTDRAPAMIRAGVAESLHDSVFAFDIVKREPSGGYHGTASAAAGFEHWWATTRAGSFALRTGMNLGNDDKTWSWGLGWRLLAAQVDYSMTVPMQGSNRSGSDIGQGMSVTYRFGAASPESEYERVLSEELSHRKDLTQALEAGEVKQWRLSEELNNLREEIKLLRQQIVDKSASEQDVRKKLSELEDRHQQALQKFQRIQLDQEERRRKAQAEANRTKEELFRDDWKSYEKQKMGGAADAVLLDQLKRILRQYKDTGVDLSEANQELLRLLRTQR